MLKGMISIGLDLATPIIKKFIKKVSPSKITLLKPVIKIGTHMLSSVGGERLIGKWRVESIYELLPEVVPKLLNMACELKPYTQQLNNYGNEFKDVFPNIVSFGNEIINPIINRNEELADAFSKIEVPIKGNVILKDMNITISGEVGKKVYMKWGEDPEVDVTLTLSTQDLFEIFNELMISMMDGVSEALPKDIRFNNSEALSKVYQLVDLLDVAEKVSGIPIG